MNCYSKINENLGTEMVFSLVSSAQEWLNVKWDEYTKEKESREQAKLKEIEEAERVSDSIGNRIF